MDQKKSKTTFTAFMGLLYARRRQVISVCFAITFGTAVITTLLPEWYRSHTSILAPEGDGLMGFSSMLSDLPLKALGLSNTISGQTDLFISILGSRSLMEATVNKFDLVKFYDVKNIEEAVKELRQHMIIFLHDEGIISVTVEVRTGWLPFYRHSIRDNARIQAREMTSFVITQLDSINQTLQISNAHNSRVFIEKRYHQNLDDLKKAEDAYNAYQTKYGVIALPEQTEATIKAAAEIKVKAMEKEVEMSVLENYVGKNHSEYNRIRNEYQALEHKFRDLKKYPANGKNEELFLGISEVPDLALKHARLYREIVIQETIMEFLLPQYEQAKIKEAKDTPTVQILDKPSVPIKKTRPKRAVIVLFFGFVSMLGMSGYLFFQPAVRRFWTNLQQYS